MSQFTDAELANFKARLVKQLADLAVLQDTAISASETVSLDQSKVGRLSRMDALQGQAMAVATAQRREHERRLVQAAIKRLAEQSFGECTTCFEEIDARRVAHNPAVALCLVCAEAAEAI